MKETDKIKWASCETWMGGRCPNQEVINEAVLIKEKDLGEQVEVFQIKIMEKAYSFCEKCEDYQSADII
jgi:hypothetical protein